MTIYEKGYVYDALVSSKNDFVGKVAYSLYKEEKVDFIKKQKKMAKSETLIEQELKKWRENKCVNSAIANYRQLAEKLVNDFFIAYANKTHKDLIKRIKIVDDKENKIAKKELKLANAKHHGFLYGAGQSLVGSIFFSIFIAIIALCIKCNNQNVDLAIDNFWKTITQSSSSIQSIASP